MPRIFDNIEKELLPALQETLEVSDRSDFCVGYFNLRGWKGLDSYVEKWSGEENSRCWLLVGMQRLPADDLREWLSLIHTDQTIDNQTALRLKKKLAGIRFNCRANGNQNSSAANFSSSRLSTPQSAAQPKKPPRFATS